MAKKTKKPMNLKNKLKNRSKLFWIAAIAVFCFLALVLFVWLKPLRYVAPANYPQKVYNPSSDNLLAKWKEFKDKCSESCKIRLHEYKGELRDAEIIYFKTNITVTDNETAIRIAKEFISEIKDLYRINTEELGPYWVKSYKLRNNRTLWDVSIPQRYKGIPILSGASVSMKITEDGTIRSFDRTYYSGISIPSTPRVPRFLAIATAFNEAFSRDLQKSIPFLLKDIKVSISLLFYPLCPITAFFNPDTDDLYIYIQKKDGVSAYRLIQITTLCNYNVYIDAITGEVIHVNTTYIIM